MTKNRKNISNKLTNNNLDESFDFNVYYWNYIFITASNQKQANLFRKEISFHCQFLNKKTNVCVIPDLEGKRIGSGGATFNILCYIKKHRISVYRNKILIIHCGGDSKRIPQYSVYGKIFAPIQREFSPLVGSTIFDEILLSLTTILKKMKSGVFCVSGDAILATNISTISFENLDALAISFPEKAELACNHGVFSVSSSNCLSKCYQKPSIFEMSDNFLLNNDNEALIDTGAFYFSPKVLNKLLRLTNDQNASFFVSEKTQLSFYTDFIFPLGESSSENDFLKLKGDYKNKTYINYCREKLWNSLNGFKMKIYIDNDGHFLHAGTTKEMLDLVIGNNYDFLGESRKKECCSFSNSNCYSYYSIIKNSDVGNSFIEFSRITNSTIGNNSYVSFCNLCNAVVPENVVLFTLKLVDNNYVSCIYGINDNPKLSLLFGKNISLPGIFNVDSLWEAPIFTLHKNEDESIRGALNLYQIANGTGNFDFWSHSRKISMKQAVSMADFSSSSIYKENLIIELQSLKIINTYVRNKHIISMPQNIKMTNKHFSYYCSMLNKLNYLQKLKALYFCYYFYNDIRFCNLTYKYLKNILALKPLKNQNLQFNSKKYKTVTVKLPLRINFSGGWTDTPPFTFEFGGSVLNVPIKIKNRFPVIAKITPLQEHKIVLNSKDLHVVQTCVNLQDIRDFGNPYDACLIQKAALIGLGIIPKNGGDFEDILAKLGTGFEIQTKVINTPKGSGLGTSSILCYAVAKALSSFFGLLISEEKLYSVVLYMEQLMSTGGGWQDQIGGSFNGFKKIVSCKGNKQKFKIQKIDVSTNFAEEFENRFCLIYTGQRRLARNILRDVVANYLLNKGSTIGSLTKSKKYVNKMADCLSANNIEEFIKLSSDYYNISLGIDKQCINERILKIFDELGGLIASKVIIGAGGGGFIGVFLNIGVSKKDIAEKLEKSFNNKVRLWDYSLYL